MSYGSRSHGFNTLSDIRKHCEYKAPNRGPRVATRKNNMHTHVHVAVCRFDPEPLRCARAVFGLELERESRAPARDRRARPTAAGSVCGKRRQAKKLYEHGAHPSRISRAHSQAGRWRRRRCGRRQYVRRQYVCGTDARQSPYQLAFAVRRALLGSY
jgi:hypothetical protein